MMRDHHAMLKYVLDSVSGLEPYIPIGDHSALQKSWFLENYNVLWESLIESDLKPHQQKRAKHIFHLVTDAFSLFLKEAENPTWKTLSLEERNARIQVLKDAPQIEQRSEEWYRHFSECITASEFSTLFSSPKKRKDLILSKVGPRIEQSSFRLACPTEELSPTGWGIRFEPVVKQIIEHKDHCKIFELGRITHPSNSTLAASPDGIIESSAHKQQVGRLVEIKCPYSRQIGLEIPFDYWVQMQIQMEVTNIDECEYVEVEIESARPGKTVDLSGCTVQGTLYLIKQIVEDGEPFEYKYVYGEISSTQAPHMPPGFEIVETIPWGMRKWHRKIVCRDKAWYDATKPWQTAFWHDVERAKQGELVPDTPNSKKQECLIQDSD